ncbi:ABC transporter ATP-binding protein [Brachybacterium saurashtrense]|uniref:ABC transporter ATP-binding protein n=1 Tax=Brachybacterium saurashtrense TaxID=556288 RepID=A0A345YTT0_9MICO|nr:ABC transporter ATP-binding protein [Brachybacterium saurashtrense]AXK47332.1 ABC transporter ATP-binding protein [Brachybacterium saurashtrense]RRR22758.1 ABC transporter ATP-binding protein [Brachybacterium saurashtrense]
MRTSTTSRRRPDPAPADAAVLEARGLRHRIGAVEVLRGVDLTVRTGELVGLVGPNGSGKTTALRALHGEIVPTAGTVHLEGGNLAALSGRERARRIAVMAQDGAAALPLPVADAVLLGRLPHRGALGTTTREDARHAARALELVGAAHLARRDLTTLSGGERQRVLLARALAQQPRLLLLDEPTNHLDISAQHHILQLVRAQRLSTLVVLHDLNLAARYCDRVVVLDRGRVRADGPPAAVLDERTVAEVYAVAADRRVAADGTAQLLFRPGP